MAKKSNKTKKENVGKEAIKQVATKSSKKGLIIGISVGVVVAVAAAITIPLVLLKKPKEPSAHLILDTKDVDYGDFSYDGKTGVGNDIDISKFIGKKDFTIYFIPIDEYKDSKFTINIVGASFTATYSETDKKVNIKGERELENKTKLSATFIPEQVSYDLSSTITGATSTIKVNEEEATTAHAGDAVVITAQVDNGHVLPADEETVFTKIHSDDIELTVDDIDINASNRTFTISFEMPENAVTVTGELDLVSYDLSSTITGATSTIKVNEEEATTAHAGDAVVITAQVDNGHVFPADKETVLTKIDRDDIELTVDDIDINASNRTFTISFEMPENAVTVTGELDSATTAAKALPNTSMTTTYHGRVEISGGPCFDIGSDVTCTIIPDSELSFLTM